MIEHDYVVDVEWTDNRKGKLTAPGLPDSIEVATPPQFPKGMPGVWSPEHLFVAAINSCLMTTFLSIAENSKLEFTAFESKASGKLEMVGSKYQVTEVTLMPVVTLAKEADMERVLRILHKSEAACLISNSVKSKIIFQPKVKLPVLA